MPSDRSCGTCRWAVLIGDEKQCACRWHNYYQSIPRWAHDLMREYIGPIKLVSLTDGAACAAWEAKL